LGQGQCDVAGVIWSAFSAVAKMGRVIKVGVLMRMWKWPKNTSGNQEKFDNLEGSRMKFEHSLEALQKLCL
jgi:hypothetical protein